MSNSTSADFDAITAYRGMRLIREFVDQRHVAIARGTVPGFTHLSAGEEASAVGGGGRSTADPRMNKKI